MLTLFKTSCYADWKGRPTHTLTLLGTGDREQLVVLMNADVEKWQHLDIVADNEMAKEDAEADGVEPPAPATVWAIEGERWEMETADPHKHGYPKRASNEAEPLREFAGDINGEFWSTVYHILDCPA